MVTYEQLIHAATGLDTEFKKTISPMIRSFRKAYDELYAPFFWDDVKRVANMRRGFVSLEELPPSTLGIQTIHSISRHIPASAAEIGSGHVFKSLKDLVCRLREYVDGFSIAYEKVVQVKRMFMQLENEYRTFLAISSARIAEHVEKTMAVISEADRKYTDEFNSLFGNCNLIRPVKMKISYMEV